MTSITIPENITTIEEGTFYGCYRLTSITIPENITSIGKQAFYLCSSLTSITIPKNITTIEEGTFYGCSSLISIVIPSSVEEIGDEAFVGCGLKEIAIPYKVTKIGKDVFKNTPLVKAAYPDVLQNPFASNVKATAYDAFDASVEDGFVFSRRKDKLYYAPLSIGEEYTVPESVKEITDYAFYMCSSLTSITLPSNLSTIGKNVWQGCEEIRNIACKNPTPVVADRDIFMPAVYNKGTLKVVPGALAAYEETVPWKYFYNIEEAEMSGVEPVVADNDLTDAPAEIFDLNGRKVNSDRESLARGIYLVRKGNSVEKIAVR